MSKLRKNELDSTSQTLANSANLRFVSSHFAPFEWFIFFGTLLGTVREGHLIKGDDDIDIYIAKKHRDEVSKLLVNLGCTVTDNRCPYFLQVTREENGNLGFIDIYFYEVNAERVEERYNFTGNWARPEYTLHIPLELIFPLQTTRVENVDVFIPNWPRACLEYLYGRNWQIPLAKKFQYKVDIVGNVPALRETTKKEKLQFIYRKKLRPFLKNLINARRS
jgi:hypothetical protein